MSTYIRKIKCPRHYILKPGGIPYIMEKIPSLRHVDDAKINKLNSMIRERGKTPLKVWRPKKDKFGNKIQNFKDYINPEVSAAEMRMRIFDPLNFICNSCKRCVTA
jgi:hypothetical protein